MGERKQALVGRLIDYLQEHGLADLSLRPMAAAAGTSARLLIFHFGSKEKLLAEVLEEMQARMRASFSKLVATPPEKRPNPLLKAFWTWAIAKENFPYLRLLYQLHMLASQNPKVYGRYLKRNSLNWLELIRDAVPPEQRDPRFATLLVAVFDGLFIELMSTGDRRRTTETLDRFIEMAHGNAHAFKPPER